MSRNGIELYIYSHNPKTNWDDLLFCTEENPSLKEWAYFLRGIWKNRKPKGHHVRYKYNIYVR